METFFISNVSCQLFFASSHNLLIFSNKKETFFVSGVSAPSRKRLKFLFLLAYEFT